MLHRCQYLGAELIFDTEDIELVPLISTLLYKPDGTPDAVIIALPSGERIRVHRHIMAAPPNMYVDHIDGNCFNNSRSNLRLATNAQNQMNARPHSDKQSKLPKGVTKSKCNPSYPYQVRLSWNGTRIQVGYFKTPEEAEVAYKKAVEFYHENFSYHLCRSK
jgi:hypothetical protein